MERDGWDGRTYRWTAQASSATTETAMKAANGHACLTSATQLTRSGSTSLARAAGRVSSAAGASPSPSPPRFSVSASLNLFALSSGTAMRNELGSGFSTERISSRSSPRREGSATLVGEGTSSSGDSSSRGEWGAGGEG